MLLQWLLRSLARQLSLSKHMCDKTTMAGCLFFSILTHTEQCEAVGKSLLSAPFNLTGFVPYDPSAPAAGTAAAVTHVRAG